MNTIYVRWLGAYGGSCNSIGTALSFEGSTSRERACEFLTAHKSGKFSSIVPSAISGKTRRSFRLGLIFDRKDIVRKYSGDVWSVAVGDKLKATRRPAKSGHTEAFISSGARPVGIIVENIYGLRRADAAVLRRFMQENGITSLYNCISKRCGYRGDFFMTNLYDWFMEKFSPRTHRVASHRTKQVSRWRQARRFKCASWRFGNRRPRGSRLSSRKLSMLKHRKRPSMISVIESILLDTE